MKKINKDKLKDNQNIPSSKEILRQQRQVEHENTHVPFEEVDMRQPSNQKEPNKKEPKMATSKAKNLKAFIAVGVGLVVLVGASIAVIASMKEEPKAIVEEVKEETIALETDIVRDDVSGVLSYEERNKSRSFETFKDNYLNMSMSIPSDYFVTEKTHLDLGVVSLSAKGNNESMSLASNYVDGIIEVMELKSKTYEDYTLYLQVNHLADYPIADDVALSEGFEAKVENYFASKKSFDRVAVVEALNKQQAETSEEGKTNEAESEPVVGTETVASIPTEQPTTPKPEEIKVEGEKPATEKPVTEKPKEQPAKATAPTTAPTTSTQVQKESAVNKALTVDKKGRNVTTVTAGSGDKAVVVKVTEYYDDEGIYHKDTEYPNRKATYYTEQLLDYGVIVMTTKDSTGKKDDKTVEIKRVPFYLASRALNNFSQVRDYSMPKACFKLIDELWGIETEEEEVVTTVEETTGEEATSTTTTTDKENSTTETLEEMASKLVSDVKSGKKVVPPEGEVLEEEVQPIIPPSKKLEMVQQGVCGGEEEEKEALDEALKGTAVEDLVQDEEISLSDVFSEEQLAMLQDVDLDEGIGEVDEKEAFIETFVNHQRMVGVYATKIKKVEMRHKVSGEMYDAYEFAFIVGSNEFYLTVVGKNSPELFYVLEDAEHMISTMEF